MSLPTKPRNFCWRNLHKNCILGQHMSEIHYFIKYLKKYPILFQNCPKMVAYIFFFFNKRLRWFIQKLYQNRSLYPHRFLYISFPERLPFTRHIKHTNVQFFFQRFCSSVQPINLILAKFMIKMHLRSNNVQENDLENRSNECLYWLKPPNNLIYVFKNA